MGRGRSVAPRRPVEGLELKQAAREPAVLCTQTGVVAVTAL